MPDATAYEIPDEAPVRPDADRANRGTSHVTHETGSGHEITIYDLALTIQGMMLNSMISEGVSPNYNNPDEILAILQDELNTYGDDWSDEYLARCYEVSITEPKSVEGVPHATKMQDTLYEAALVHASELFWGFVSRHATRREVREMDEELRAKYLGEARFTRAGGDVIRRVPEALSPEGRGAILMAQFPGRPGWLSEEDALRTTRLLRELEEEDPYLPNEYDAHTGRQR